MQVTVDQPCIVLVRKLLNEFEICASNPSNAALTLNLDINRHLTGGSSTWNAGTRLTRVPFSLPGGNSAGNTVVQMLAGADESRFISGTIPATMQPNQVTSVNVTMKNIGGTTWTQAAGIKPAPSATAILSRACGSSSPPAMPSRRTEQDLHI